MGTCRVNLLYCQNAAATGDLSGPETQVISMAECHEHQRSVKVQLVRKNFGVAHAENLGQKERCAPCFVQQTCRVRSGSEGRLSVKVRLVKKSRCKPAPAKLRFTTRVYPRSCQVS